MKSLKHYQNLAFSLFCNVQKRGFNYSALTKLSETYLYYRLVVWTVLATILVVYRKGINTNNSNSWGDTTLSIVKTCIHWDLRSSYRSKMKFIRKTWQFFTRTVSTQQFRIRSDIYNYYSQPIVNSHLQGQVFERAEHWLHRFLTILFEFPESIRYENHQERQVRYTLLIKQRSLQWQFIQEPVSIIPINIISSG